MTTFNPDAWLSSLTKALRDYAATKLDPDLYDLVMSWPSADEIASRMPLDKVIVHFEVAEPRQMFFGLGDNVVNATYDETAGTILEQEAHCHEVTLDVGVWASAETGGPEARLEAREILDSLFNGPTAFDACMAATQGVEIRRFSGGRNLNDAVNDVAVWRMVDIELIVRVYSRTLKVPQTFISQINQEPGIRIDDIVIIG